MKDKLNSFVSLIDFDELLKQAIVHQHQKVLNLAQSIDPSLTQEDILQPFDTPSIGHHPLWNYEDGVLAGLKIAQILLTARHDKL